MQTQSGSATGYPNENPWSPTPETRAPLAHQGPARPASQNRSEDPQEQESWNAVLAQAQATAAAAVTPAAGLAIHCKWEARLIDLVKVANTNPHLLNATLSKTAVILLLKSLKESGTPTAATYRRKREYDKAIRDYTEVIRLDPNNTNAYYYRGRVHQHKRDHDKAIPDYAKVISLDANNTNAYYNRGAAYANFGVYDKAISDYTETIRLNPNYAKGYYKRGICYREQGKTFEAQADFDKAKQLGYSGSQ